MSANGIVNIMSGSRTHYQRFNSSKQKASQPIYTCNATIMTDSNERQLMDNSFRVLLRNNNIGDGVILM